MPKTMEILDSCPICLTTSFSHFMTTKTMMHDATQKQDFSFVECDECSVVFLNPRVEGDLLGPYYRSFYLPYRGGEAWGKYGKIVDKDEVLLDKKRVNICLKLGVNEETKILDIGCGKPSFLKKLVDKTNCKAWGSDFSIEGWKKNPYRGVELLEGDVHDLDLPQEHYDLITMWHYLEHDYHPTKTIQLAYKLLKPGGKIIIEVPNVDSYTRKWQREYWQGWHTPRHTVLYSPKTLGRLLTDQDFELVKQQRHGTIDGFTLWWMGEMEKKQLDWSASLEKEFLPFVLKKIATYPLFALQRLIPLGIQLTVAQKPG